MKAERCIITRVKTDVFAPCLAEIDTNQGKRYPTFRRDVVTAALNLLHQRVVLALDRSAKTGREFIAKIGPLHDERGEWIYWTER